MSVVHAPLIRARGLTTPWPGPGAAMDRELAEGQEAVARTTRGLFAATERAKDEATADLLAERLKAHEKNAWMLRAMLA